jgi:hypothetical protein
MTNIPDPISFSRPEEQYNANLQPCQIDAKRATPSQGKAFFYFYPKTMQLHYTIYHDLSSISTAVTFSQGKVGGNGKPILPANTNLTSSQVRGIITLNLTQWGKALLCTVLTFIRCTRYWSTFRLGIFKNKPRRSSPRSNFLLPWTNLFCTQPRFANQRMYPILSHR